MVDSVGVHRRKGTVVTDFDHVLSSIEDLLTTRRLSRVMLRQYGSDFPDLIDAPMTDRSLVLFFLGHRNRARNLGATVRGDQGRVTIDGRFLGAE
ncbi:MAG: hypothetical protein ACR2PA_26920 [Hyphomicrobiaceae bacterium]